MTAANPDNQADADSGNFIRPDTVEAFWQIVGLRAQREVPPESRGDRWLRSRGRDSHYLGTSFYTSRVGR